VKDQVVKQSEEVEQQVEDLSDCLKHIHEKIEQQTHQAN